jgi:chemotaxis protein MotB
MQVAGARLSAVGYGEYQPVTGNDTPEQRARNRRIELVLIPR